MIVALKFWLAKALVDVAIFFATLGAVLIIMGTLAFMEWRQERKRRR